MARTASTTTPHPAAESPRLARVAATADLHFRQDRSGSLAPELEPLRDAAGLLLVAGDLTERGDPVEAAAVARELRAAAVPVVAVLGNHDHHLGMEAHVAAAMGEHGVRVLRGEGVVEQVGAVRVGVAGITGFGGGFPGTAESRNAPMKELVAYAKEQARLLEATLAALDADVRIALLHYSPCRETLDGEPVELYPLLGSSLLGEAIDRAGADLVVHGHAHYGREEGSTPGGIPVRNVAIPVTGRTFRVFLLPPNGSHPPTPGAEAADGSRTAGRRSAGRAWPFGRRRRSSR